jgi:hypothetical protein
MEQPEDTRVALEEGARETGGLIEVPPSRRGGGGVHEGESNFS